MLLYEIFNNDDDPDVDHRDALQQTGFWGRAGAGCIMMARSTGRFLIAHRSDEVQEPNTWGTWGGAIDQGLTPQEAVRQEVSQEAGYHGPLKLIPLYVFRHPSGFTYYNYLAVVDDEFDPELNWETQDYDWFTFGRWPRNKHPGLAKLLSDPASLATMQAELEAVGKMPSPRRPSRRLY